MRQFCSRQIGLPPRARLEDRNNNGPQSRYHHPHPSPRFSAQSKFWLVSINFQSFLDKATTPPIVDCGLWRARGPTLNKERLMTELNVALDPGAFAAFPFSRQVATHLIFGSLPLRDECHPQTTNAHPLEAQVWSPKKATSVVVAA